MLNRLILGLTFALASFAAHAASKPTGAPTTVVPDYNVTIAVWAEHHPIGDRVAVFELQNGEYQSCGDCSTWPVAPDILGLTSGTMDGDLAAQGGNYDAYVQNVVVPIINKILRRRFPPLGGGAPTNPDVIVQINYRLSAGYQFRVVNGVEVFVAK